MPVSFRFGFNKPVRKKKAKALQLYSSFKAEALLPFLILYASCFYTDIAFSVKINDEPLP